MLRLCVTFKFFDRLVLMQQYYNFFFFGESDICDLDLRFVSTIIQCAHNIFLAFGHRHKSRTRSPGQFTRPSCFAAMLSQIGKLDARGGECTSTKLVLVIRSQCQLARLPLCTVRLSLLILSHPYSGSYYSTSFCVRVCMGTARA